MILGLDDEPDAHRVQPLNEIVFGKVVAVPDGHELVVSVGEFGRAPDFRCIVGAYTMHTRDYSEPLFNTIAKVSI